MSFLSPSNCNRLSWYSKSPKQEFIFQVAVKKEADTEYSFQGTKSADDLQGALFIKGSFKRAKDLEKPTFIGKYSITYLSEKGLLPTTGDIKGIFNATHNLWEFDASGAQFSQTFHLYQAE